MSYFIIFYPISALDFKSMEISPESISALRQSFTEKLDKQNGNYEVVIINFKYFILDIIENIIIFLQYFLLLSIY